MELTGTNGIQDWVGKVIHWELRKRSKFDHADKWYVQNQESGHENETYKLLWDFEIQANPQVIFSSSY